MSLDTLTRKSSKAALTTFGSSARRRPGDVVILCYHRIGSGGSEIDLPTEAFERQLRSLASDGEVITLDEAVAGAGGVVLTFDDGTRDFYEVALPRLVEFHLPATLYLRTGGVANGGRTSSEALTWTQLRACVASGLVDVGSHTHTHANLAGATEREAEEEMRRSRELIHEHLRVPCRHFAYPWAVGGPAADRVARRLFVSAAWDAWRTNRAGRFDPYRLGRVPILRSDGQFFFRRKVQGQLDTERWLYRALRRGPWGKV